MTDISIIDDSEEDDCTTFLQECRESILFHSITYKKFCKIFYLRNHSYYRPKKKESAMDHTALLKENKDCGNIINLVTSGKEIPIESLIKAISDT